MAEFDEMGDVFRADNRRPRGGLYPEEYYSTLGAGSGAAAEQAPEQIVEVGGDVAENGSFPASRSPKVTRPLGKATQPLDAVVGGDVPDEDTGHDNLGDDWIRVPATITSDGTKTTSVEWRVPAILDDSQPATANVTPDAAEGEALASRDWSAEPVDAAFMATVARDMKVQEAYAAPDWIWRAYNRALNHAADNQYLTPLMHERLIAVRNAMLDRYDPKKGVKLADKAAEMVFDAAQTVRQGDTRGTTLEVAGVHLPEPNRLRTTAAQVGGRVIGMLAFGLPSETITRHVEDYEQGHQLIQRFADELEGEAAAQLWQIGLQTRESVNARITAQTLNNAAAFVESYDQAYGDGTAKGRDVIGKLQSGVDVAINPQLEPGKEDDQFAAAKRHISAATDEIGRQLALRESMMAWLSEHTLQSHATNLARIYSQNLALEDTRWLRREPLLLRPLAAFARHIVRAQQ